MKKIALLIIAVLILLIPIVNNFVTVFEPDLSLGFYINFISRLYGIIAFIFLFFQFVLSSKLKIIEKCIGQDILLKYHKITGIISFFLIFMHFALPFLFNFIKYGEISITLIKVIGIIVFSIVIITAGTALFYKKLKMKYQLWKAIHFTNYIVLPLLFIHSFILGYNLQNQIILKILWIILISTYALIVINHKIIKPIQMRTNPYQVTKIKQENYNVWSLYFKGRKIDYKPGQFMFIKLKIDNKLSDLHPFTISSSPTSNELSITTKKLGDFTSTIKNTKIGDIAYIDAPYGVFSFLNNNSENLVFISGGIGITPFRSMLDYISDKDLDISITLLWGNNTQEDLFLVEDLKKYENNINNFKYIHILSKDNDWEGETGFIDKDKIKKYVDKIDESEFFICGPPPMMKAVITSLHTLGVNNKHIHYEKFEL